jgi:hypothetical protein
MKILVYFMAICFIKWQLYKFEVILYIFNIVVYFTKKSLASLQNRYLTWCIGQKNFHCELIYLI